MRAQAAALALLILASALPARAAEEQAQRAASEARLRAGFGVAPLPMVLGAPLGGYGGLVDRKARSVLDPPESRALVLELEGSRLGIVALDIVIPRGELRAAVLAEVAPLGIDALLLAATHTHSGPGGYIEGFLAARVTSGRFRPEIRAAIVKSAVEALRAATENLQVARLTTGQTEVALAENRTHSDGARETALPVLELLREDAPPIVLFAYGAHATTLSVRTHAYSADYIGAARRWIEARGARALFLAGPLGDQRPVALQPVPEGVDPEAAEAEEIGAALANAVWNALPSLHASAPRLRLHEQELEVRAFEPRRFCAFWWLKPFVRGAAERVLPESAPLQAWAIGDARLLALPAEPTSELGSELRASIRKRFPDSTPFVLAHANEWTGYALTPRGYREGGYESCLSFQGPTFGTTLVGESERALERLAQLVP